VEKRGEVTRLISRIRAGDEQAATDLMPIVYKELRRMAAAAMRRERPATRFNQPPWCTKLTSA